MEQEKTLEKGCKRLGQKSRLMSFSAPSRRAAQNEARRPEGPPFWAQPPPPHLMGLEIRGGISLSFILRKFWKEEREENWRLNLKPKRGGVKKGEGQCGVWMRGRRRMVPRMTLCLRPTKGLSSFSARDWHLCHRIQSFLWLGASLYVCISARAL